MFDAGDRIVESADETARALTDPELDVAADFLTDAVGDGKLVTIFGHCVVDYEGRAASDLGPGDRHLMVKPDGTTLVHSDEGQQPLNWMPPQADVTVSRSERKPENWQSPGSEHVCRVAEGDGALVVQ